jgi:hypothetical protein
MRATVAECIALLNVPKVEKAARVAEADLRESQSREHTYTFPACATKGCRGTVRILRAANNHPGICTGCYLKKGG